jgi:2-oxoglutarate ferredoxin oxidoreductase subunit beta
MRNKKFSPPQTMYYRDTHYCAGCGHGIVHRLIAEIIEELAIAPETIAIAPVGCAVIAYNYWKFDCSEAAHGRALAVATGIKRIHPRKLVFTYQGDGDLAAIGTAETIHAANRGENISCIFINNSVYGMTGGQMAPTTLVGQKTATTSKGRNPENKEGYPLKITEILATLSNVVYAQRTTVVTPQQIRETKEAIKQSFKLQLQGKGFSIVEVLSPCPTIWGKNAKASGEWIINEMTKIFPLGRIK